MDSAEIVALLVQGGAVVALYLWNRSLESMFKEERKAGIDKDNYIKESDRENLKMLINLTNVIDKTSENDQRSFAETKTLITEQIQRVIEHINSK